MRRTAYLWRRTGIAQVGMIHPTRTQPSSVVLCRCIGHQSQPIRSIRLVNQSGNQSRIRPRPVSLQSLSTTTTTRPDEALTTTDEADSKSPLWQSNLDSLEQESRLLLQQSSHEPADVKRLRRLVQDWNDFVEEYCRSTHHALDKHRAIPQPLQQAANRVHDLFQLYDSWWSSTSSNGNSSFSSHDLSPSVSSNIFAIALQMCSQVVPNGYHALAVLEAWNHQLDGDLELAPTVSEYNAVLSAFARELESQRSRSNNSNTTASSDDDLDDTTREADPEVAAQVAQEVLQQLREWGFSMAPTSDTYHLAIQCMAGAILQIHPQKATNDISAELLETLRQCVEVLLNKAFVMSTVKLQPDFAHAVSLGPSKRIYQVLDSLCLGLACCVNPQGSVRMEEWCLWSQRLVALLGHLNTQHSGAASEWMEVTDSLSLAATAILRLCLDKIKSSRDNEPLLEIVDSLVKQMADFPCSQTLPTTHQLHLAMLCLGSDESRDAATKKNALLRRMEKSHRKTVQDPTATESEVTESFNRLMMAHYHAKNHKRVLEIWNNMTSSEYVKRNSLSFATILKSLADVGSTPAAEMAHAILKRMVARDRSERHIQPTAQHFGSVMVAWSKSRHPKAGTFCQQVLDVMKQESQYDSALTPNVVHYTALITSLGNQSKGPGDAKKIIRLFQEIRSEGVEPDMRTYKAVLRGLANSGFPQGGELAVHLIEEMKEASKESPNLFPDRQCYVNAIMAMSGTKSSKAADGCEAILEKLEKDFVDSGRVNLRPDSLVYRVIVDAWVRNDVKRAGKRAEALLDRMEAAAMNELADIPDKRMFSAVMNAHWKSGHPDAVSRIEHVLDRMKSSFETGNECAKPDAMAMNVLLLAYARSDIEDKASICWDILNRMCEAYRNGDLDMRPTSHSFAAVINACAFTSSQNPAVKDEAVKIALTVMNELDKGTYDRPNEYTFRYLMQVMGRQIDDMKERSRIAKLIFTRCCQEGFVDDDVMRLVRKAVPDLYNALPKDENDRVLIPSEWKRSVATE